MSVIYQVQPMSHHMDVDQPPVPVPAVVRNRSYSHQIQSNSASSLGVAGAQNHRMNFEFNLEDHIKKTRKAATYLKQIIHSQQCGGHCGSTLCRRIVAVLMHLDVCEDDFCAVAGCSTTKRLVRHRKECTGVTSSSPTRSHSNSVTNPVFNNNTNHNDANSSSGSSFADTPRTSVESTVSTLSSSASSITPFASKNGTLLDINLSTSPQRRAVPHFCLLCVLARSDSLTPRSTAIIHDAGYNTSSIMMCATDEVHSPAAGDEDDRFMPVISDEIIEFSKIPFQQRSRVHALSPMRSKTYSDSQFVVNNNNNNNSSSSSNNNAAVMSGLTSPLSPGGQPTKKFRSKSCNAASVDLDSLKKTLQFPQSPYVGTFEG